MNGPSKDAGVERIDIRDALEEIARLSHQPDSIGRPRRHLDAVWAITQAAIRSLPHPPVDQAAEEVAGRLEDMLDGVTSIDEPGKGCVGFVLPDMGYQRIEALGDEAATLIRSQSARIAELEGALSEILDGMEASRNDIGVDDWIEIATAALAPSVASETCTDETRDRREVGR